MQVYLDLLKNIMEKGVDREDRTGTGTRSIFGTQMRFNLNDGFPLLTTKKVHLKSIIHELLWFISGSTNIKYLQENGVRIWNEWADENGDLGPVYGKQWRDFETPDGRHIDQLSNAIDMIKNHPDSRRIIVCAWNPSDVDKMALPPCHTMYQFYVANGRLSCQLYQRSDDSLETAKNRLAVFYKQTSPLIEYYEKAGLLLTIEATDSEEIMAELVAALEK